MDRSPNGHGKANGANLNGDGNSKRKMRQSNERRKSYKDVSEDDSDDEPMVGTRLLRCDQN
jgi:hypothetical protein